LAEAPLPRIRKYIFDYFEAYAVAPVLEQVMREFNLSRDEAADAFRKLQDAHHISLVAGTTRILMAFPFSAVTTPFRTAVGERTYFANCAWDAVAIHVALNKDTRIDSFCHHCASPIQVKVADMAAKSSNPKNPLVFLALPASKWWDNITNTCSNNMVFFSSAEHLDEWRSKSRTKGGAALTVDQTLRLSIPTYKQKMHLDYARPGKEELTAWFESLGLTGSFWKL